MKKIYFAPTVIVQNYTVNSFMEGVSVPSTGEDKDNPENSLSHSSIWDKDWDKE